MGADSQVCTGISVRATVFAVGDISAVCSIGGGVAVITIYLGAMVGARVGNLYRVIIGTGVTVGPTPKTAGLVDLGGSLNKEITVIHILAKKSMHKG